MTTSKMIQLRRSRKNFLAVLFLIFNSASIFSQSGAPQLINYQAVARDAAGNIITTGSIGIKFEILQGIGLSLVYGETQTSNPSAAGIFTASIGGGIPTTGIFSTINWFNGPYYLRVSIDPTGGMSYTAVGTNQLLSVPYALYAENTKPPVLTITGNSLAISGGNTVTLPGSATPTITGAGITNVVQAGNSYTIGVVTPTLIGSGSTTVTGSYPIYTISSVGMGTTGIIPSSITINPPNTVTTNTALNSSTINVVSPTITGAGSATVSGAFPNFTITTPVAGPTTSTITGTGVASVSPLTGNNFTVNVPPTILNYNNATGIVSYSPALGTNTIDITPTLNFGAGILTVGPPTNTVNIGGGPWVLTTPTTVALAGINNFVGIGTNSPTEKLQVQTGAGADISIVATGLNNANLNLGTTGNHFLGQISYNGNNNNMSITSNAIANRLFFEFSGRTGIGNNAPVADLDVTGNLRLSTSKLFLGAVGGVNSGYTGIYENSSDLNLAVFKGGAGATAFAPGGNSIDALTIKNTSGFVGIGTTAPSTRLEINNAGAGAIKITDGTQGLGKILTSDAAGLGTWQVPAPSPGSGTANYLPKWNAAGTGLTATSLIFDNGVNVGIGTNAPAENLQLQSAGNSQISVISPAGNVSSLSFGTPINHNFGRIEYNTTSHSMSFWTNNTANRVFIDNAGHVGIGLGVPVTLLHVAGAVTIADGTQADGLVYVSDAVGKGKWTNSSVIVASNPVSCQSIATVSTTPTMFPTNLATFTKTYASSTIEVILQTDLNVFNLLGGANNVTYQIMIDGIAPVGNSGKANYFLNNGGTFSVVNDREITIIGEFTSLATGSHNVQLWAYCPFGGSASSVFIDPGCFGASSVIVKEIK